MRAIPSLSALLAFEAAARLGSFKDAAKELNRSSSAISHQIRGLEKELGVILFDRNASAICLTAAARQYLATVTQSLDLLRSATASIQGKKNKTALSISLLSSVSTLWLIPLLEQFQQQYPDIEIELHEGSQLIDSTHSQLDGAIRYDLSATGEWPNMVSWPLLKERLFPVCSTSYLNNYPEVGLLEWSDEHQLLINSRHPNEWNEWVMEQGVRQWEPLVGNSTHRIMDTSNMTLTAAKNSMGIALGRTPFVNQYLQSGELVRIGEVSLDRGFRHFFVHSDAKAVSPALVIFKNWLTTVANQSNEEFVGERETV